ncbi:APC family permease [Gemella cuniculi]|uniref:APC family permease n=1 Tax=Gemella cuniculi TaxID=150240 RepID=UPI0003F74861|nr:amino acid permease [Gemella cuniculi]
MDNLKKDLGFLPAFSTVVGIVIGSGVFFKAAIIYKTTGNVSLGMIAWILGGIITICAGLTVAELAAAIPETGGMIVWIERAYGRPLSYLLGWAQTVIYFPASMAAAAIIFSTQCVNLFQLNKMYSIPIAIIVALSVTGLNLLGSKAGGLVQTAAAMCKLIPIFAIVIFGLFQANPHTVELFPNSNTFSNDNSFTALGSALLATMYAYDGWIAVGNIAGEMKNPKRDLPRAIFLGLSLVMVVYLLINVAYLMTMPMEQISGNQKAASEIATLLFGGVGGKIITIGILVSVYGTLNGYTMTGIRVPYAMAIKNQIPFKQVWTKLNRFAIPHYSAFLILGITIIMIFSGQFDALTDFLLFTIWFFFVATFIAVIILRKKEPDLQRPYKVPLYPTIPIIAILGGSYILISTLFAQFSLAIGGVGLTLAGLLFYKDLYTKFKK